MRYRLRTLLILLAVLPPLLAWGWLQYATRQAERRAELERQRALAEQQRALRLKPRTTIRWVRPQIPGPPPPGFRGIPGASDYQFPPQAPWRLSDEESAPSSRFPFRP